MKQREIIDAISALAEVVDANRGWLGNEGLSNRANDKIDVLIPLLNQAEQETDNQLTVCEIQYILTRFPRSSLTSETVINISKKLTNMLRNIYTNINLKTN